MHLVYITNTNNVRHRSLSASVMVGKIDSVELLFIDSIMNTEVIDYVIDNYLLEDISFYIDIDVAPSIIYNCVEQLFQIDLSDDESNNTNNANIKLYQHDGRSLLCFQ